MSRACVTCQHNKRAEIDRRLAAGEPATQVARDYDLNVSSLHRHRANCLKLGSSNAIKKEAARGTAAVALLPSKDTLSEAYARLCQQIDEIVAAAKAQGSLSVAVSGLNSLRQSLDSLARLAGYVGVAGTHLNVAVQTNVNVNVSRIADILIKHFDREPDVKARIAQALLTVDGLQDAGRGQDAGRSQDAGRAQPPITPKTPVMPKPQVTPQRREDDHE